MMADDGRWYHTLEDSGLMCGGSMTSASCVQWNSVNGTWKEYLTLNVTRKYHVSWTPDPNIGTYLMGGARGSRNTTTLIKPVGSQEPGFSLKYNTLYIWMKLLDNLFCNCVYYSFACAIEDPDTQTVVITGGWWTRTTVSVYGLQGWVEDLQPLNIRRYWHACSSYMSAGTRVR